MKVSEAWIEFGGTKSSDIGVLLREEPVVSAPVMRVNSNVAVPGRSGKTIITDGCFEPVTVTVKMVTRETANLREVRAWLCGYGDLVLGDDAGYRFVNAHIVKDFKYTHKMRSPVVEFEVAFQCDPFRQMVDEPVVIARQSGYQFGGRGDMPAHPVVVIEGIASDVTVAINGIEMAVTLDQNIPLYIDCENKLAYTYNALEDMVYAGSQVELTSGDWYELTPDVNRITFGTGVDKVTLVPHWRYF